MIETNYVFALGNVKDGNRNNQPFTLLSVMPTELADHTFRSIGSTGSNPTKALFEQALSNAPDRDFRHTIQLGRWFINLFGVRVEIGGEMDDRVRTLFGSHAVFSPIALSLLIELTHFEARKYRLGLNNLITDVDAYRFSRFEREESLLQPDYSVRGQIF